LHKIQLQKWAWPSGQFLSIFPESTAGPFDCVWLIDIDISFAVINS